MKKPIDKKICEAALLCAEKHGWGKVTLEQISKIAKVPAAQIKAGYKDTRAILPVLVEWVSAESLQHCAKPDMSAPLRERLFEILMARFDVLQTQRKAFLSIADAARRDPKISVILIPAQIEAMKSILNFSKAASSKLCAPFTPLALWGVFVVTFRAWQSDETLDMTKTMAALDRYLRYADRVATLLRMKSV